MGPLSYLRVVDLTDLRGAFCARILADLGAEVIKVEGPSVQAEQRASAAYRYRNANRRGTVIDVRDDRDAARFGALLADADVVIDNNSRDLLGAATQDEVAALVAAQSHVVHVALRDFGLYGPRAAWRLEPLTALAASGTMFATGFPGRAPVGIPGYLAHDCASAYGAVGAVIADMHRRRTGVVSRVEVSVQEAALAGTTPWSIAVRDYLRINPNFNPLGPRNADGAYWVLPAADGWVRTVIGSVRQWEGFVHVLGDPDALLTPEWSTPGFRLMNSDVVRIVAQDCLTDRTRAQLFDEARHAGATLGVLHEPLEFVSHPQTATRGFFTPVQFGGIDDAPFATVPYKFSAGALEVSTTTPDGAIEADIAFAPRVAGNGATRRHDGEAAALPLLGVRVVEFGMAAVVPELAGVLSELGADVIKIESVTHPDVLRSAGGRNINAAFPFNAEARGRRSVAIDISTAEGRELARALCATADIVAENQRGGSLDRVGLGDADIRAVNPNVIYVSSQGYGRGGPFGTMPAYGPLNFGFTGLHTRWCDRDAPYPCGTSLNHPDHIAGKLLAAAVLAALEHRERTGIGQSIDMAQTEAAAYFFGEVYLDAAAHPDAGFACGNESLTDAPHGVYRAMGDDRWLAIAVTDDAWPGFVAALSWPHDASLATAAARVATAETLDARVAAWVATRDAEEAATFLQSHGVSAMAVMGPEDHHADEHLQARGFIVELHHPDVGVEHHVGNPLRLDAIDQRVAASARRLGADTHEVLAEVLGYTHDEVDDFVIRGVCR